LCEHLVAAGVPERVVDCLEEIDVAKDQRQRAAITCGALHLAWKVFAEEASARHSCQVVCRGELAIFDERNAEHRFELGYAARGTNTRAQFGLRRAAPDAIIGARDEPGFALTAFIELGDIENERCALRLL
jgi:hypothetical protein